MMRTLQKLAIESCTAENYYELLDYIDIETDRDLMIAILNGRGIGTVENLSKLDNDRLIALIENTNNKIIKAVNK